MADDSAVTILLNSVGISPASFDRFVSWALAEHLVSALASDPQFTAPDFFSHPDALKQFRNRLNNRTNRSWGEHDLIALFDRVKSELTEHYRHPIEYGEYLKLLWQVPLECAVCKKSPPDVEMHIDHVVPASRGGSSKRPNLQFLCAPHNLKKSNVREVSDLWLDFR
jgi:5-methylcytosine-specific restriction endonuclease McrA